MRCQACVQSLNQCVNDYVFFNLHNYIYYEGLNHALNNCTKQDLKEFPCGQPTPNIIVIHWWKIDKFQLTPKKGIVKHKFTWNKSPMLIIKASGLGLMQIHFPSFTSCNPPIWSWCNIVRKSLSVCGTRPKTSKGMGHGGYLFIRR